MPPIPVLPSAAATVTLDLRDRPDRSEIPGGVALIRWPSEAGDRWRIAEAGLPRLLLVEAGAAPPDSWESDEDWIRVPADPVDLHHRAETLRRRWAAVEADVVIDDDGLVWRDGSWAALAPIELALVEWLVDRQGQVVRRDDLEQAAWPDEGHGSRALDRAISRARVKLHPLGLEIHRIPSCGYLLDIDRSDG